MSAGISNVLEIIHRSFPDGDPLKACIEGYFRDPDGFEANRTLGFRLMRHNNLRLFAEPHLAKALARDRGTDDEKHRLLEALGQVSNYRANYDGAAQIYAMLSGTAPDYLADLGLVLSNAGRFKEASDAYARLIENYMARARHIAAERRAPITALLVPYLPVCLSFGEMASKIGFYVMARVFGLVPDINALLIASTDEIVNACLMDYWREQARDFLAIISEPEAIGDALAAYPGAKWHLDCFPSEDGRVFYRNLAYPVLQRRLESEGRPPLLKLTDRDKRRGWKRLRDLGMSSDAWFACLHVRESSSSKENVPWSYNLHRNARITDYLPAIEAVTARGGWVVRVGDPSMTPLPPMRNVIDLATSDDDIRADWMDVFCCAACRFIIATASGPMWVSWAFGVPIAATNWFPLGYYPSSRRDIFIHKLLRRGGDGRYLTICETTVPPIPQTHFPGFYTERDLEVLDNTPEDITDAAIEMIDRLDGGFASSPDDDRRQARYRALSAIEGIEINSRVGARFLAKHPFLIGEDS